MGAVRYGLKKEINLKIQQMHRGDHDDPDCRVTENVRDRQDSQKSPDLCVTAGNFPEPLVLNNFNESLYAPDKGLILPSSGMLSPNMQRLPDIKTGGDVV